jgi:NitT/TauT family transport system permease protein
MMRNRTIAIQHADTAATGKPDAPWRRIGLRVPRAERFLSILSPVLLLAFWELACRVGWLDTRFFPAPTAVFREFLNMILSGELITHVGISLSRILVGFAMGAVPGIVIGLAMGISPIVRAIVQPLVNATFPIPKIAILPLFILIFGLGEVSKYAIIAVTVIYLVLINTYEGVRDISPIHLDVGQNFGASRLMTFRDIAFPGALPQIIAGLRISMGVALLVIVAAEFVGAKSGIGFLIWNSWQIFEVEKMYVGLMVCALLGFVFSFCFDLVERFLLPWRVSPRARGARIKRAGRRFQPR